MIENKIDIVSIVAHLLLLAGWLAYSPVIISMNSVRGKQSAAISGCRGKRKRAVRGRGTL